MSEQRDTELNRALVMVEQRDVFILRLWWTTNGDDDVLRGEIEHVATGERVGIASAEALTAFVNRMLSVQKPPTAGLR